VDARRSLAVLLLGIGAWLVTGCGIHPPTAARSTYASEAGIRARDACFAIEHLPPDFEVIGRQILDNRSVSRGPLVALTPPEVRAWQRLSGAWLQYAYEPPSMPAEDADGFLTQDELERALARAHAERQKAPFAAAACRLDLFATPEGAHAAFQAMTRAIPGRALPHRARGDESTLVLAPAAIAGFARLTLWFRLENVVAAVSVTAACDPNDATSCTEAQQRTESLAALLLRRVAARVPGLAPAPAAPTDPRSFVEARCPERDYTSCVAEALATLAAVEPATLCVSPYGEWRFVVHPPGRHSEACPDEWEPVASFPLAATAP